MQIAVAGLLDDTLILQHPTGSVPLLKSSVQDVVRNHPRVEVSVDFGIGGLVRRDLHDADEYG